MTTHVHTHILARFITLYGEPKTDNIETFFDEYIRALKGYAPERLVRAINLVVEKHRFSSWPTIGEVIEVLDDTAPPRKLDPIERAATRQLTEAERRLADKLVTDLKAAIGRAPTLRGTPAERGHPGASFTGFVVDDEGRKAAFREMIRAREAQMYERDREMIRARMADSAMPQTMGEA